MRQHFQRKRIAAFHGHRAMTLMEMLVVLVLMSFVGLAVYHAIFSGIKVWQRGRSMVLAGDAAILFDRLTEDLRNAFFYSQIAFVGTSSQIEFPGIVYLRADKKRNLPEKTFLHEIGRIRYKYDPSKKVVLRQVAGYGQALKNDFMPERLVMSSLEEFRLRYYYFAKDQVRIEDDTNSGVPQAVEATLRFREKNGHDQTMRRFIRLPWKDSL